MENIRKGLPSFFTSLGLIAGCISIIASVSFGNLTLAGMLILIAALLDFIDGFVARMLNAISDFGKQLDSLSDVISFGVAPAMIMYRLIIFSYVRTSPDANFDVMNPAASDSIILFSAFLITVFAALRLAKFNIDPTQKKNFKGLAVPGNALFFAGLGFAAENSLQLPGSSIIFTRWFLLSSIVISCFLQVSNISMFSLKFYTYSFKSNWVRYFFLAISAVLLILFWLPGFAPIMVIYVLLSLINNWFIKQE